jgi:hypothetical protein
MVFVETITGLGAVKTAFDMAKALENIHETVARDRAIIDLQKEILAAQAAQALLVETVGTLKKEVTDLKAWGAEKERYQLQDLGKGFYAYIMKEGMENGEPLHALCTTCYQRGSKSILQGSGHIQVHERSWDCHACKTKIKHQWNDMATLITKSRSTATA